MAIGGQMDGSLRYGAVARIIGGACEWASRASYKKYELQPYIEIVAIIWSIAKNSVDVLEFIIT